MKHLLISLLLIGTVFSKIPASEMQAMVSKIPKKNMTAFLDPKSGIIYFEINLDGNKLSKKECRDIIRISSAKCDCNYRFTLINQDKCKVK